MKTTYKAGNYYVKIKGRGLLGVQLTQQEAKMMFKFQKKRMLEVLGIGLVDSMSEYDIEVLSNLT